MKTPITMAAMALMLVASSELLAAGTCKNYVSKVSGQLDRCGTNQYCLEVPFRHAMNVRNYGERYIGCKAIFDHEISKRLGHNHYQHQGYTYQPPKELLQEQQAVATSYTRAPYNIPNTHVPSHAASCNHAINFLTYATRSCRTDKCVDHQYTNTVRIPRFSHCTNALMSTRDSRKIATRPSQYQAPYSQQQNAGYQYYPANYNSQAGNTYYRNQPNYNAQSQAFDEYSQSYASGSAYQYGGEPYYGAGPGVNQQRPQHKRFKKRRAYNRSDRGQSQRPMKKMRRRSNSQSQQP